MALAAALTVLMAFLLAALTIPAVSADAAEPQAPSPGTGTPSVQTCKAKASITLKLPEKDSVARFACDNDFELYPKQDKEVFSKDCRTKEILDGMTRTQTQPNGGVAGFRNQSPPIYTLKADKQPSKKTLCYLCAKTGTTEQKHGTAENYCTIYVESGARTQLDLICTFVLALPCVLAAFQLT